MRSESEDQSQHLHRNTGQDKGGPQWRRSEKHNRGQHQKPSRQQQQETQYFHSKISRYKAKRLAWALATQVKISHSHGNQRAAPTKMNMDCASHRAMQDGPRDSE